MSVFIAACIAYVVLDAAASVYTIRRLGVYETRRRVYALVVGR